MDSHELSDREALIEIVGMISDNDYVGISSEETEDGYTVTLSTSLDEDIVFHVFL